jgi:hypothetical protein
MSMGGDGRCIFNTFVDGVRVDALFVARPDRTSLEMIEHHYAKTTAIAHDLDELIANSTAARTGNLPGTLPTTNTMPTLRKRKPLRSSGVLRERATGVEPVTSSLGKC